MNVIVVIEEVKDQNELQAMSRYPLKHTVVLVHFESPTHRDVLLSIDMSAKQESLDDNLCLYIVSC